MGKKKDFKQLFNNNLNKSKNRNLCNPLHNICYLFKYCFSCKI